MADDRTYIRVHDGMDDHPKIVGLSDGAFRLLMRSWAYSSRQLTDGRIPEAAWRDRGSAKARRELVDAGLAHLPGHACHHPDCPSPPPKHVQMHDYLEHQRSAAEVAELKRKRSEAGSKGGRSRANAQASAKQVLEQTASKTVASTETETDTYLELSVEGGSHVSSDSPPPRYPDHCEVHADTAVPGRCGDCADVRKANQQRPLTVVREARHCYVHAETYVERCRGCVADEKAAS
jgi:hypothetical protein